MSISDLESRVNTWVANNDEWTGGSMEYRFVERNTSMDGSGATYYYAQVRFTKSDTKSNLLQKFADKVKDKVDWYRVGYHDCDNDEAFDGDGDGNPGDCSFDPAEDPEAAATQWTAKDVTIPSGVPDFPSAAYDQTF